MNRKPVAILIAFSIFAPLAPLADRSVLKPTVEVEETVYTYEPANNGAGPTWCHGNTCIVRLGDRLFASGLETIPDATPLNNCLPTLYQRTDQGWDLIYKGEGRTREPSPLAMFRDEDLFLSINPTLTGPDEYAGPSEPKILAFEMSKPSDEPEVLMPRWEGEPPFTEHSYRSFVADGNKGELILFQNIEYTHAEWAFRDSNGDWSAQGRLDWPFGSEYEEPRPIRVCYPAVALKDRAVYFCGVSDIIEPKKAWREYKFELTGRKWDYDFRRLFYTYSEDITTGEFHEWVEIASREKTAGGISPKDLYVTPENDVFVLWTERAIDERLREKFFPEVKQEYYLNYAKIRDGRVVVRNTLVSGGEEIGGERPGEARFHVTDDERLLVFYYVSGHDSDGNSVSEYRLAEIKMDGNHSKPVIVKIQEPMGAFFTSTVRAGCPPSNILDVFGSVGRSMKYVRIRIQ